MIINLIVAIDKNNAIGKANAMPWHLPEDLKYFKNLTSGFPIIMGKNTFISLHQRPLPNRFNIVISNSITAEPTSNLIIVNTLELALEKALQANKNQCFIIGGGQIYKQSLAIANCLYITKVDTEIEAADVYMPLIDYKNWNLVSSQHVTKNEKNIYDVTFCKYNRKAI
jgi:dihydrofolate reductase